MIPTESTSLTRRRRTLIRGCLLAILGLGFAVVLWVVMLIPPSEHSFYPKCTLHSTTGLHCPGCGMTRSLHSFLNGDFEQAIAYNVLAPIVLPILGIALFRSLWAWVWDSPIPKSVPTARWRGYIPWVLGTIVVLFLILRNIPAYPFNLLAPHELTR